jgi:hypothetical protein
LITEKTLESTSAKGEKRGGKELRTLSPRSKEACDNNRTTLLQGIMKTRTERAMENHRKVLHELTTHVPKESTEWRERM